MIAVILVTIGVVGFLVGVLAGVLISSTTDNGDTPY